MPRADNMCLWSDLYRMVAFCRRGIWVNCVIWEMLLSYPFLEIYRARVHIQDSERSCRKGICLTLEHSQDRTGWTDIFHQLSVTQSFMLVHAYIHISICMTPSLTTACKAMVSCQGTSSYCFALSFFLAKVNHMHLSGSLEETGGSENGWFVEFNEGLFIKVKQGWGKQ